VLGDPERVEGAVEVLRASVRPVIMAGSALWWDDSGPMAEKLAEKLQAPIYANGMARGCMRATNPLHLSHSRGRALQEADAIVVVGAEFDFRLSYGESAAIGPSAKIIQIHIDPVEIGHNRAVDFGIVGHTQAVLEQLCEALGSPAAPPGRKAWLDELLTSERAAAESIEQYATSDQVPIHPARLCREIDDFLDDDAIIIGDGGDIVSTGARMLRPRAPGHWLDPGPFGCLGVGVPFALAAKFARPGTQVLVLYGDGSFGFNGMEMDTAVRFNLPIVTVIGNDGGWGQMRFDGEALGLDADSVIGVDLGFTHYEKMVEGLGGFGAYVEEPSAIREALDAAFGSGRPACVNVKIDPSGSRQLLHPARGMVP
jgi:acetolactate synthase-1/2/3 large subunit